MLVTTTIQLNNYRAQTADARLLQLGTKGSHGIEQLQIEPGEGWQGLAITAVFSAAGEVLADPVAVPEDGRIDVPPGATARALSPQAPGTLVFCGMGDGLQRITANLPYLVTDHGPADGEPPEPTPDVWAQIDTRIAQQLDAAVPPDAQPGQVLTRTEDGNAWQDPSGGYTIGAGLKLDPGSNTLSVDTADAVEQDNTRPITSAAVFTTVGNIDALLATI